MSFFMKISYKHAVTGNKIEEFKGRILEKLTSFYFGDRELISEERSVFYFLITILMSTVSGLSFFPSATSDGR